MRITMVGYVADSSVVFVAVLTVLGAHVCHGGPIPDQDVEEKMDVITLWPGGKIPYLIPDGAYSQFDKGVLLAAMKRWEEKTCIKFVPWTKNPQSIGLNEKEAYLQFYSEGRCFSKIGVHKFQPQLLGIGKSCLKLPTVIHELGHAIGLVHEIERVDRDWYVDILRDNLNPNAEMNFATTKSRNVHYPLYNTPYDYKSIMHYGPKAWSSNGKPVLVTKDPAYQDVIGTTTDVSFFDAMYVNKAYNCSAKCSRSLAGLCRNGGFLGGPNCQCVCQDGYSGLFCDQPLPGFEKIIRWSCQKGWEFNSGRCYLFQTQIETDYAAARSFCQDRNSSLYVMKTRPEVEWIIKKTGEQKLLTTTRTFWVGLTTNKSEPNMKWEDGSFVDTNLVSIASGSPNSYPKCAQFNGEGVVLSGCDSAPNNGFICVKDFDARCGGRYTITKENVTIESPGYPQAYPKDTTCTYILQTDDNSRIQLTFNSFTLETNCKKDYVEVLLKNDVLEERQRYCGTQLNGSTLTSEGNLLILKLRSDSRGQPAPGFHATVTEVRSAAWTTASPFSVLDSILNAFDEAKGRAETEEQRWTLRSLFQILKSLAFSKLL